MELGNHVWRYAVRRGDDDPARAAFVEQVEARLRAEATAERRRVAAKKATEALRAKLRAAGIDPHTYYSRLAQRGNAARWRKHDADPPASEAPGDGAQTEAAPPASEAAARIKECAPAPPQASQAAAAEVVVETRQAQAVAGAQAPRAAAAGVQATEAAEAAESTPRRNWTLPVYLL
jgi:hypothetical protein